MFLRHDPSSLCNTTGARHVAALSAAISSAPHEMLFGRRGILDSPVTEASNLDGCVKVKLLSNFALLHGGASRQPA
ncbi:hypothetical protein GGE16_005132 [Rhizobium leguminosarum]|uniref:Uncharacterized protein n=1 Tax=Rhizobium leguminosarum TaxID=384 RepID=A0AAE2MPR3_RHILE|nr:hypothetical protein [Rhizobium leguminosarum]MBB4435483.1 hypothetical protein [Rhizobium esperanzae]MBB4293047.1 hypothetical protein [Rhizobium leguminosarum]MBB4300130.1 hypothetical protein [Rhizobium leguminosarum]MBB5653169.1 hypothetical protein [Rhizobium leguminosarum]MBB6268416.1 hypothetical protein [Rhizobium leguminosarum]